ncbi:MAG TPA: Xaa-Pro peptidase family protein [Bryobacteraceae bacterium]|nr:Xaa-Pro peptidase family protein [Bryobacteraceae bacterium]
MLTLEGCRKRRERLLVEMMHAEFDVAVITSSLMINYFTGVLTDAQWPQAFALRANGDGLLVSNREPQRAPDVRFCMYTGYTTERPFGRHTMHDELTAAMRSFAGPRRAGIEEEHAPAGLAAALAGATRNITPILIEMRRRKDPDELDCMRAVTRLTEAGYAAAKARLEPGMTEYQMFSAIQEAIIAAAGTSVELRGDFAVGTRAIRGGGPPTNRRVEKGDLYILDLFPVYDGYTCDLCRTFCAGKPTAEQQEVWAHVLKGHDAAQRLIRPGAPTRAVYEALRDHLHALPLAAGSFWHHAGHGVGMEGWEQPWLNAGSDQTFVEGEVIACEPGLYDERLRGGIRLEHNYLVTDAGPQALDTFPMEL